MISALIVQKSRLAQISCLKIAISDTPLRRPMLQVLGSRIKVLLAEPSRNTEKDAEEPVEVGRGEA